MRRIPAIALGMSITLAALVLLANRADGGKGPRRVAWSGIARGPLSSQRADTLEALLIDELAGYDSFRLVDAGGSALDERLLAQEAARVAQLLDEGIDHLLNFRQKLAIQRIEQAIDVFETRLTPLRDHELLHDALLAKAEALQQSGKSAFAVETLKQLAALSPKRTPTRRTHPAKFFTLWESAKESLGLPGQLKITAEEPACSLLLDGQPLGNAPITATGVKPGRHYLVARWPFFVLLKSLQVAPGRELSVELTREGPADHARRALLETIVQRQGLEGSIGHAKRIADLADAEEVIVAAVRSEGGEMSLLIARHDAGGNPGAVARMGLSDDIEGERTSASVRRLSAALFVDKRVGEFELAPDGGASSTAGLSVLLYGRAGELRSEEPADAPEMPRIDIERRGSPHPPKGAETDDDPPPSDERAHAAPTLDPLGGSWAEVDLLPRVQPDPSTIAGAETRPLTKEWWFWAAVGVTFVGAMIVGGAVVFQPNAESTTVELVLP